MHVRVLLLFLLAISGCSSTAPKIALPLEPLASMQVVIEPPPADFLARQKQAGSTPIAVGPASGSLLATGALTSLVLAGIEGIAVRAANEAEEAVAPTITDIDLQSRFIQALEEAKVGTTLVRSGVTHGATQRPDSSAVATAGPLPRGTLTLRVQHGFQLHSVIVSAPYFLASINLTDSGGRELFSDSMTFVGAKVPHDQPLGRPQWWSEKGRYRSFVLHSVRAIASHIARTVASRYPNATQAQRTEASRKAVGITNVEAYSDACAFSQEQATVIYRYQRYRSGIYAAALCESNSLLQEPSGDLLLNWTIRQDGA